MANSTAKLDVIKHLLVNAKPVTSAELIKELDSVPSVLEVFEVMYELVNTKHVTQESADKYGKRVLVWSLASGQDSGMALWEKYILPTLNDAP